MSICIPVDWSTYSNKANYYFGKNVHLQHHLHTHITFINLSSNKFCKTANPLFKTPEFWMSILIFKSYVLVKNFSYF